MLYKVAVTFNSMYQILKCDHSNESYSPCVLFVMMHKVLLTFESMLFVVLNPKL